VRFHAVAWDPAYRWDGRGRLFAIGDTEVEVDALGELAAIDGAEVLWDTADQYSPVAWLDGALVSGDDPGPRDPFGAPACAEPAVGYRGEVEFAGHTWLRARVYDPSTRSFLSPDPLPPLAGTAYAANTYHYAGNDPIGHADPLGLRPVTEQELREIRDRMGSNFFSRNADWIVAGVLIVGGIAVMATGVGGPLGAAMIGGALLSAGSSAAIQKVTTGHVNYTEVAIAGLIGGAAGGLGYGAGALVSGGSKAAAFGRGALAGGVESFAGGAGNRAIHGGNPFDPRGMATDLLLGGGIGGVGGRLGAPGRERVPQDLAVNPTPPSPLKLNRPIGRATHNQALADEIANLPPGAYDLRVNQQQVNLEGVRVGTNRPDLQYSLDGRRHYVEFEGFDTPRGDAHEYRLLANDPKGAFHLRKVD
jgi:RHS repeat-associated protein